VGAESVVVGHKDTQSWGAAVPRTHYGVAEIQNTGYYMWVSQREIPTPSDHKAPTRPII